MDSRPFRNEDLNHSLSGKEPQPTQVLTEHKENIKRVEEEESYKYQQQSCDQLEGL